MAEPGLGFDVHYSPIAGTQLHIADGHVIELGGIRNRAGPEKGEIVRIVLVIEPTLQGEVCVLACVDRLVGQDRRGAQGCQG